MKSYSVDFVNINDLKFIKEKGNINSFFFPSLVDENISQSLNH